MNNQSHSPAYVKIGDIRFSALQLSGMPHDQASLVETTARAINSLVKRWQGTRQIAQDLFFHVYIAVSSAGDLPDSAAKIQRLVSCKLRDALRESSRVGKSADFSTLSAKRGYCDLEAIPDDGDNEPQSRFENIPDDPSQQGPADRAALAADVAWLRQNIRTLPPKLRKCADFLLSGEAPDAAAIRNAGFSKSRFYELRKDVIRILKSRLESGLQKS